MIATSILYLGVPVAFPEHALVLDRLAGRRASTSVVGQRPDNNARPPSERIRRRRAILLVAAVAAAPGATTAMLNGVSTSRVPALILTWISAVLAVSIVVPLVIDRSPVVAMTDHPALTVALRSAAPGVWISGAAVCHTSAGRPPMRPVAVATGEWHLSESLAVMARADPSMAAAIVVWGLPKARRRLVQASPTLVDRVVAAVITAGGPAMVVRNRIALLARSLGDKRSRAERMAAARLLLTSLN